MQRCLDCRHRVQLPMGNACSERRCIIEDVYDTCEDFICEWCECEVCSCGDEDIEDVEIE